MISILIKLWSGIVITPDTLRQVAVIMSTTLFKDLQVGQAARVVSFQNLNKSYRNRLMSLGMTPGTEFNVQHVAPLGDPVQIRVRGFHLSLRWAEAGPMEVAPL